MFLFFFKILNDRQWWSFGGQMPLQKKFDNVNFLIFEIGQKGNSGKIFKAFIFF